MPLAVNHDTGDVVFLDDQGQWQPAKRAVNPQTKKMLAFDGKDWSEIPSKGEGVSGYVKAALKGLESGVSLGFSPQIAGAGAQAGLMEEMPYLSDEQLADVKRSGGPEGAYTQARDAEKASQEDARQNYPKTYVGGEVAGALALPLPGATGATVAARAGRAALTGGAVGTVAGASEGDGLADRAAHALTGGIIGAGLGGVGAPLVEGVAAAGGRALAPVINTIRGKVRPDDEAARRVVNFIQRGIESDPNAEERLTPQEFTASRMQPGGGPAVLADIGGEPTRALARSAANTSPEGRRALNKVVNQRFEDQSQRVIGWLQDAFNYPDAAGLQKAIDQVQKSTLGPRYKAVYRAGDKPLWNPELERLTSSPDVVAAMREAATKGKSRAVTEGFGGFNPGVSVDQSGNVTFAKGPNGVPTYPNLQFWDYTKRALDDAANAAGRSGRKEEAATLGNLARQLRGELDNLVPSYKGARATAASFFGAENALEAGQNFVTSKLKNREAAEALAKMSPMERQLFQDGFVSKFIDTLSEAGDRRNILNQIAASPAARARLNIALGPQKATQLEAGLRVEGIMDKLRTSVQGNSTTARQLAELGLAGGTDVDARLPRSFSEVAIKAIGAALNAGRRVIDQNVSRRVAEMLASNDPAVLTRGLRIVAKNPGMMNALRSADEKIAAVAGEQAKNIPALQAPSAAGADQDQNQVPRPVGQ